MKKIIGRKGHSLRSITILLIFAIMILSSFFYFISEGGSHYGRTVESGFAESFDDINSTLEDMHDDSKSFQDKISTIKEFPGTAIFYIPSIIIDALLIPFKYINVFWNILTAFMDTIPIPKYVLYSLEAALLFFIAFLIVDAVLRYKNT